MSEGLERFVERLIALSVQDPTGARRLPPERELSVALSISRGALREQLAMLENLGILLRRQGHGAYLAAPDASFIRTYFTLLKQLGYLSNDQFSSAREMLEQTIAAEAARSVTDTDIDQLRALVQEILTASAVGDLDAALEADFAFHRRLYAIVDNPIFNMLGNGFSHILRENVRVRREVAARQGVRDADGTIASDTVHNEIVDALADRSPSRSRAAMQKHFAEYSALAAATPAEAPIGPSAHAQ